MGVAIFASGVAEESPYTSTDEDVVETANIETGAVESATIETGTVEQPATPTHEPVPTHAKYWE